MHEPIEYGISQGGIADQFMPLHNRYLTGHNDAANDIADMVTNRRLAPPPNWPNLTIIRHSGVPHCFQVGVNNACRMNSKTQAIQNNAADRSTCV